MGGSCTKLSLTDCQKGQKIQSSLDRSTSEDDKLSNHDLMMDKFNEFEKSYKEMTMIKEKLRSQEKEIQIRKDKVEKMEMEDRRKWAEIAEKLLVADKKLADVQKEMLEKEARNKKALCTMEERIGEIQRAQVGGGGMCKSSKKRQLTGLDSVGEEKDDEEY